MAEVRSPQVADPGAVGDEPPVPLGAGVAELPPPGGGSRPEPAARGTTRVSRRVLAAVVAQAAFEVPGVRRVGRRPGAAVGGLLGLRPAVPTVPSAGLELVVDQGRLAGSIELAVQYGVSIGALAQAVRRRVAERARTLVGLELVELDVVVAELVPDRPPPRPQVR